MLKVLKRAATAAALSLCLGSLATAQTSNTAPAKPPPPVPDMFALFQMHYKVRTEAFRDENLNFQNVVLLGDSITEGFKVQKFFPFHHILNRGIGSDVIGNDIPADDVRGVLKRMDESVFDCATSHVFIMIGINDLGMGHSVEQVVSGWRQILDEIHGRAPEVTVHIESLLPCRGNFAKHNEHIRQINAELKKLADEYGYKYLDLYSLFCDNKNELKAELTHDGLHCNDAGYKIWTAEIEKQMGWRE